MGYICTLCDGAKPCPHIAFTPEIRKRFQRLKENLRRQFLRQVRILAKDKRIALHMMKMLPVYPLKFGHILTPLHPLDA